MKCLYACGDSWTAGAEIPEPLPGSTERYYNTWPFLLGQILDIPLCVNQATGAGSNDRIFRKTNNFIFDWIGRGEDSRKLTIVVGWTTPERTEIFHNDRYYKLTTLHTPHGLDSYWNEYYKMYNDNAGQSTTLRYMLNLRLLCKGLGIRYYDFVAIGTRPGVYRDLANKQFNIVLDKMYTTFTWNDYVDLHNHARYEYGHPTINSHRLWAQELAKVIA
jgi:hypothetical protein